LENPGEFLKKLAASERIRCRGTCRPVDDIITEGKRRRRLQMGRDICGHRPDARDGARWGGCRAPGPRHGHRK
ncbi:unnamed protein product, partial [Amoebophrya sp. A120]